MQETLKHDQHRAMGMAGDGITLRHGAAVIYHPAHSQVYEGPFPARGGPRAQQHISMTPLLYKQALKTALALWDFLLKAFIL